MAAVRLGSLRTGRSLESGGRRRWRGRGAIALPGGAGAGGWHLHAAPSPDPASQYPSRLTLIRQTAIWRAKSSILSATISKPCPSALALLILARRGLSAPNSSGRGKKAVFKPHFFAPSRSPAWAAPIITS